MANPDGLPDDLPREMDAAGLAFFFRCSDRHIRALAAAGIVRRVGHGKYDVAASIGNYCEHLRAEAERRVGSSSFEPAAFNAVERTELKKLREQIALLRQEIGGLKRSVANEASGKKEKP